MASRVTMMLWQLPIRTWLDDERVYVRVCVYRSMERIAVRDIAPELKFIHGRKREIQRVHSIYARVSFVSDQVSRNEHWPVHRQPCVRQALM